MKTSKLYVMTSTIFCLALTQFAHAGRPMTVDDANVNDVGAGHVEVWYARMPGKVNTWNTAPAYSPIKDIELSAVLTRDQTDNLYTSTIQAKWRITPSNPAGCNLGLVVGVAHTSNGGGSAPYLNGLATCNQKGSAFLMNLGLLRPEGGQTQTTWGVAYERELWPVIAHIEYFGQEAVKPTLQVGLRHDIVPGLQLDGTVGRSDNDTVFSLGLKKTF